MRTEQLPCRVMRNHLKMHKEDMPASAIETPTQWDAVSLTMMTPR